MQGPKILHLHTVKGKGFEPAEKNPGIWHAPGKFDPETGERITTDTSNLPPLYQTVFGETLVELAEKNPKNCRYHPRHAHRMFHEPIDESHARPRLRRGYCRRTCRHILRRYGKKKGCNLSATFIRPSCNGPTTT